MANISEKVEQIRKAIYGKDVRESIASGIEAINDHVETIVEAEATREANEVERENAEEIRETNERARETAEGVRVEAEIARQIEVTNARESTVKSKTFATLGERLEESEQDLDNHETAADPHDQYALDTDLATLQTEVTSHKAESASKHITESGGNKNGNYIKFDDGTMICEGTLEVADLTCTQALDYGGYRSGGYIMLFPATFLPGTIPSIGGGFSNSNLMGKIYPSDNTKCTFVAQTISSFSTGIAITVTYIAVGRWK